jgi:hypothetical protein
MAEANDISTSTGSGLVLSRRPEVPILFIGGKNTKPPSNGWPSNDNLHDDNDNAAKSSFVLTDQRTGKERTSMMAPVIDSDGP